MVGKPDYSKSFASQEINMKIQEFEKQLQKDIDKDITIEHAENGVDGLSGIYYKGKFIVGCPQNEIREEVDTGYGIEIPRPGDTYVFIRHRTISEVTGMLKGTLNNIKDSKDYSDAFFGEGDYTDDKLKA